MAVPEPLSITSREQLRREIAEQTEQFLRGGGRIDTLGSPLANAGRQVGPVWWDARGSLGPIAQQGL